MSFVRAFSFLTVVSVVTYTILSIPSFGLGTWLAKKGDVAHAVEYALKAGYRHVDAAAIYRNEEEVGQGIKASGVSRDKIWVTSKLWNTDHRPDLVRKAIEKSIANLGVEYLDLYLIHWPVAWVPGTKDLDNDTSIVDTWKAMEELVRDGLTRNIGVSNFSPKDIKNILKIATIRPYAENIKVIAYSPLANTNPTYNPDIPSILHDEFWTKLAGSKNATVAQTVLAWGQQRGTVVIPKSTHEKYIDENFGLQDIKFTEDELKEVAAKDKKYRFLNPGKDWGVDLFKGLDGGSKKEEEDDRNEDL
ncbi:Aldo-keto reductase [Fusarium oxysporum f. sp. vasinfectum]|nr:Aldo-keto reductase [Fusarium oxysporum f. sp. vasinfectum]